jgi:predicted transcriptional regulator
MKHLSEERLARAFELSLRNGVARAPFMPLHSIAKEIRCLQGRPDFVASPTRSRIMPASFCANLASGLSSPSQAKILALLNPVAPRTERYLESGTGLSRSVIHRSIATLTSLGLIRHRGRSSYVLSHALRKSELELWAFEVKVDHWRRALYQALQYQAFAHRSIVVISERWAHRLELHSGRFRMSKVGVISLDPDSGKMRVIVQATKHRPASRFHYLYALGSFLRSSQIQPV